MGMFLLPKVVGSSYLKELHSSFVMKVDSKNSIEERYHPELFSSPVLKLSLDFS
jgi:hypothetical protein